MGKGITIRPRGARSEWLVVLGWLLQAGIARAGDAAPPAPPTEPEVPAPSVTAAEPGARSAEAPPDPVGTPLPAPPAASAPADGDAGAPAPAAPAPAGPTPVAIPDVAAAPVPAPVTVTRAEPSPSDPAPVAGSGASVARRVFLNCRTLPGRCHLDYLRQELSYFDIVRDRNQASIQIDILQQSTGSGASSYTVQSWLRGSPARIERSTLDSDPSDTVTTEREGLLQAILRALYGTLRDTPAKEDFELSLPPRDEAELALVADPWDHWVLAAEIGAAGQGESLFRSVQVNLGLNARRVTERARSLFRLAGEYQYMRYGSSDDERISGQVGSITARGLHAVSLGDHWGLGGLVTLGRNDYENLALYTRLAPALELNLFDYEESFTRQIRFVYQAGAWFNRYFEPTIYDRSHDLLPYHALTAVVALNQDWGGVQLAAQANSFLHRPELYRLGATFSASFNLFEGFALTFEGSAKRIHDQISLGRVPPTEDEVVLGIRQLPKSFEYGYELGFSYTFGSVHDTVVNPRFGQVDLDDD